MSEPVGVQWGETLSNDDGVWVRRAVLDGRLVMIKSSLDLAQAREIQNYALLHSLGIDTIRVVASGEDWLALDDIADSEWRLATAADLRCPSVVQQLARWYAQLHVAGRGVAGRVAYCEADCVSAAALEQVGVRWPFLRPWIMTAQALLPELSAQVAQLKETLLYNDFAWDNMVVARDGSGAVMFDFNLMGRGYRYADVRNVTSGLDPAMGAVFREAYVAATGPIDPAEVELDDALSHLVCLVEACRRGFESPPSWAVPSVKWLRSLGEGSRHH